MTLPDDPTQTLADVLEAMREANLQRQVAFVEWLAEEWYDAKQQVAQDNSSVFAAADEPGERE